MKIKQLLSGVVAFAMLVTAMPVQAFAADDAGEATTWTKDLTVDELYHTVQDQLDENGTIALEDLAGIEAIASDVRDGVTGQLTAIMFDDQQVVLAEQDGSTSYTLTFAEEDTVDAAPAEPAAQPTAEPDAGESVTVPSEPAANDASTESQQTTGPPAQPGVSLTVTEEEVFTTEAEAEAKAQEQGVDPAAVSTQTGEDGQVLGATLTVNETKVSQVTLVYMANTQTASDEIMLLSPGTNVQSITLSVGESKTLEGAGADWSYSHRWSSSDNSVVKITESDDNHAVITANGEGTARITHSYWKFLGREQTETWSVTVQKKEYGKYTFDVYYLIGDKLPDPLYSNGLAENYGPSRNDTPMCEVTIDIGALLKLYPNGMRTNYEGDGNQTWCITYDTCNTDLDTWWNDVWSCMDEASKEALQATGLANIFKGYVLKNQNQDGDYHLDGQLVVPPPVNVVELYLDGEYIGGAAVSEDAENQTTKEQLRTQYADKFQTEFGEGTVHWQAGNIYFQTADKYYRLTESAEPNQSITDDTYIQFTNKSNDLNVAQFFLTSEEMAVQYEPTKILIQKTDVEEKPLSGAQFGLYSDESCETKIDEAPTQNNGQAEFTVAEPGPYYVKEIAAPEGYVLSDEVKTVSVTPATTPTIADGTVTFALSASPESLTFTNEAKPTVQDVLNLFQKQAVAAEGSTLPADLNETFTFTLKQGDMKIATATATVTSSEPVTLTSATNGTTKLDDGTYTLTEDDLSTEQTEAGWSKDTTTYTIEVEDGQIAVTGGETVDDKYLFDNTYSQPKATLTVQAVDDAGNVLSAEGWPKSVELPIGASYQITVGTPSDTEDVNVSTEITTDQRDHYIYVEPQKGCELEGTITGQTIVTLVYGLDNIGIEGPDTPDGVLDKYQVLVEFISADESTGTVSGTTQKVYTKTGLVNPGPAESGYINVSADGVTITPTEGYVFAYWTKDDETKETTLPKNMLYVTSDVEKIVFKAHFGEDKIGEQDPDEGDGIADMFQVLVTFEVENGSWNNDTSDSVQKVFTRKSQGKPSLTGTYTLQDTDWPSVGQKPAQGFKATGSWYEGEVELSLPVKLSQNSQKERTFTFIYEPVGQYELWIEHRYLGGPLDNDQSYPYEDSAQDFGERFYSTRFDSSKELVLAGTNIQLQALLSDKMDAGYKYGSYAWVTAPGVDLELDEAVPSWEMPEGWMKLVILYVPRTDLSYTVNYLDAETMEPIQTPKTVFNQTYGAEITSETEVVDISGYTFDHADKDALTITAVAENNVINLYYKKASYTVTYQWADDVYPESAVLPDQSTYQMGDSVVIDTTYTAGMEMTDDSGTYRFAGWSVADISVADGQFAMPARNVAIIGTWVPMITVTPADITIYTGGNGYTGAVTGSATSTSSGLPEPGFYVTLPDALDNALKQAVGHEGDGPLDLSAYVTITAEASDGKDRTWTLERYDNQPDHESIAYDKYIYRIVPANGQAKVRVQFTDPENGNTLVPDDQFAIDLNELYKEYDMSINTGAVQADTVKITVDANKSTDNFRAECAVDSGYGTLTVRGVVDEITTDIVDAVPENADNITAIASAGTEYWINGSHLEVAPEHEVKLLVDEIVEDAQSALRNAIIASSDNDIDENFEFEFKYLDLVDTSNGNVWITPSQKMTVFWPYPNGTDDDTEFQVIHFVGLDRNYDDLGEKLEADGAVNYLTDVEYHADGITFTVDSFSPFALVWEDDDDNGGGGAHHPEYDPDDEDDEDDEEEIIDDEVPLAETPWLNTEDHYAYIVGYAEDGTVRPNANITRAEVATIFFRLLTDEARDQFWMTTNNFSDVAADAWYNNAVSTMVNMGIIRGYEDGTFRPNANITRAEFAAIAARFMTSGYDVEDDLFIDIANHWAREDINDAAMAGWIHGYADDTFRPDAVITRAEAVTLVNNVLQRKPDADHMLDSMIKWPDNPEGAWYYEAIQEATNSHDYDLFEDAEYETWTALQENRDWAALEADWLNAHRTGGEVM